MGLRSASGCLLCLAFLGAGCHRSPDAAANAAASPPDAGAFVPRLTDSSIAATNFLGRIDALEGIPKRVPDGGSLNIQWTAQLVDQLLARGQVFGKLEDYDEAESWVTRLEHEQKPPTINFLLLRARTRGALHRFDEAEKDLAAAEKLGAPPKLVVPGRAGLLQARGDLVAAEALSEKLKPAHPDILWLGAHATLLGNLGQFPQAEVEFERAVREYDDVSPIPVAWVYFQRGLMRERRGDLAGAREIYQLAHQVFPAYAPATGHLAQTLTAAGDLAGAQALLEPLVKQSSDPEYVAQLAAVIAKSDAARSQQLRAQARARYEELLAKHPDAFADHAARFFLDTEPKRASELAEKNLALRHTAEAYELALDAALAAGNQGEVCKVATGIGTGASMPDRLKRRAEHVQGC